MLYNLTVYLLNPLRNYCIPGTRDLSIRSQFFLRWMSYTCVQYSKQKLSPQRSETLEVFFTDLNSWKTVISNYIFNNRGWSGSSHVSSFTIVASNAFVCWFFCICCCFLLLLCLWKVLGLAHLNNILRPPMKLLRHQSIIHTFRQKTKEALYYLPNLE